MQVCQSMVQVKFIVWYCHLIVILFLILISPKSLKLTTPGELNCTEDRIHSHTSSLQWKLRQCLEMRRAWNADQWHLVCWMTVSSLDPQLQSVYRDAQATSPSLAHLSGTFLHCDTTNASHEIVILPSLLISISLLPSFASRPARGVKFQYAPGSQSQSKPGEIGFPHETTERFFKCVKQKSGDIYGNRL